MTQRQESFRRRWFNLSDDRVLAVILVAPLMIWLAGTILYPMFSAIQMSFMDIGIIGTGGEFVGFENYEKILSSDRFWMATWRSLIWVVSNAVIQTIAAFLTATVLKQRFPGNRFARVWVILSWIVPTVVVVIIWRWLLGTSGGIINFLLMESGIISEPTGFFNSQSSSFATVTLINSWRWFPLMSVIFLAGMQGIPEEFYEAAAVDGATAWQRFRFITLPGLQHVMFVMGLIGTMWSINVFDVIWLLTKGGPSSATTTLPVFIYDTAFNRYRLSRSAAASVVMGIILLVFAVLFIRFLSPRTDEE